MNCISPTRPDLLDWSSYYPDFLAPEGGFVGAELTAGSASCRTGRLIKDVTVADIGCGFGGLLVALAPKLPDELLLGSLSHFDVWFEVELTL